MLKMKNKIIILALGLFFSLFTLEFYLKHGKIGLYLAGCLIIGFFLALAKQNYFAGPRNPYKEGTKEHEIYEEEKARVKAHEHCEERQRRNDRFGTGAEIENSFLGWDSR